MCSECRKLRNQIADLERELAEAIKARDLAIREMGKLARRYGWLEGAIEDWADIALAKKSLARNQFSPLEEVKKNIIEGTGGDGK